MIAQPVRALTVRQPYADAIAYGTKRVENRSRPVPAKYIGATLLIHAAKEPHASGITADQFTSETWPDTRSAIIATARLVDSHHENDGCCVPWGFDGQWHWVLEDVRALDTPVPASGALGLWKPGPDLLQAVLGTTVEA